MPGIEMPVTVPLIRWIVCMACMKPNAVQSDVTTCNQLFGAPAGGWARAVAGAGLWPQITYCGLVRAQIFIRRTPFIEKEPYVENGQTLYVIDSDSLYMIDRSILDDIN